MHTDTHITQYNTTKIKQTMNKANQLTKLHKLQRTFQPMNRGYIDDVHDRHCDLIFIVPGCRPTGTVFNSQRDQIL
jgi:hypothetical protein